MRSLVQPRVLTSAGLAALLTALACCPRLLLWTERPYQLWFMVLTLAWAAFILWSFVFGWDRAYAHRAVFVVKAPPALWGLATLCGLAGALILHLYIDAVLRPLAPDDYPSTIGAWAAMTLFALTFEQLFLCFAPFAFFIRVFGGLRTAWWLTVLFGVFLVLLKISSSRHAFSLLFVLELLVWRLAAGCLSLHFYLNGGALLQLWWMLLLQLRHLVWW
jgi:hypothetical protein